METFEKRVKYYRSAFLIVGGFMQINIITFIPCIVWYPTQAQ